jgi:hypothetical protein
MVSARSLLAEAERRGSRFRIIGDRLEAAPRLADRSLYAAIGEHKAEIVALLRERQLVSCATDAVLFAQALLRQGRFMREPAPCAYHCGHAGERCRRCGAPLPGH